MKAKILQALIICAVIAASFFAIYHRSLPVEEEMQPLPSVFTLTIDTTKQSKFGFLGESRGDDLASQPFNSIVLSDLLTGLNNQDVKAIFFGGNLVSGVEKGIDGKAKPIDYQQLNQELKQFSVMYDRIFDKSTPFYPVLGDREVMISRGAEVFLNHFHLYGGLILNNSLLYTVSAGPSFFAVIATDERVPGRERMEQAFIHPMLEWLERVLTEGAKKHKYLFVVGHEPAYPSSTTFAKNHLSQRNAFWKLLMDHKVLAYFSSGEHLFDRSNRWGVWQIISGGGGAPLREGGGSEPFFHSLVLTIPGETPGISSPKGETPGIQVMDRSGKVIEEFSLSLENQPLYQMRISLKD